MRRTSLLADQEPVVPWHHTTTVYGIAAGFALAVMLFAGAGISVAAGTAEFSHYVWVAWLLLALGAVVLLTSMLRLGRRLFLAIERYRDKGPGLPL